MKNEMRNTASNNDLQHLPPTIRIFGIDFASKRQCLTPQTTGIGQDNRIAFQEHIHQLMLSGFFHRLRSQKRRINDANVL